MAPPPSCNFPILPSSRDHTKSQSSHFANTRFLFATGGCCWGIWIQVWLVGALLPPDEADKNTFETPFGIPFEGRGGGRGGRGSLPPDLTSPLLSPLRKYGGGREGIPLPKVLQSGFAGSEKRMRRKSFRLYMQQEDLLQLDPSSPPRPWRCGTKEDLLLLTISSSTCRRLLPPSLPLPARVVGKGVPASQPTCAVRVRVCLVLPCRTKEGGCPFKRRRGRGRRAPSFPPILLGSHRRRRPRHESPVLPPHLCCSLIPPFLVREIFPPRLIIGGCG